MPNNRVFYASHGVSVGGGVVRGAQSVGVTTNFNLEQAFQLGQLSLYDNIAGDPEVEVTISKALDGESTIYKLATGGGKLVDNANEQTTIVIGVGSDTAENLTSTSAVRCTGMYISSLSYTFGIDGNFTEDVTFVGNHKDLSGSVVQSSGTAKMLRRQNFQSSTVPPEVSGKNISSITISAELGRESMYKLGEFAPFHRFVNFPLEVTCAFEVIANTVDNVTCDISTSSCTGNSLPSKCPIVINLCDGSGGAGYSFDLGDDNRLQSVAYAGGDTGGGNVTITYSYSTYNDLNITG